MTRHVFILSRRVPELYSYLKERFAGDAAVEVILDRRHAQAAPVERPFAIGRGGRDRRQRPEADAELLTRSHTIVTISDAGATHQRGSRLRRRVS